MSILSTLGSFRDEWQSFFSAQCLTSERTQICDTNYSNDEDLRIVIEDNDKIENLENSEDDP